jgi:hypothetical protein
LFAGVYDSETGLLALGTLFIAAAVLINKIYDKIIIDTLSVSSFIIGFILFGLGFVGQTADENGLFVALIIIALVSLCIVRNFILSFISVLIISGSILALILSNRAYDVITVYVSVLALITTWFFISEAKIITACKSLSELYNPVRTGLIFSFIAGLIILAAGKYISISQNFNYISSLIIIAAIVYLVSILLKMNIKTKLIICVLTVLVLMVLSPAISGSILIILLSFRVNYKTGLVLGLILLIYSVSQYYYDLNLTLLIKSILMMSSGILFIALYLLFTRINRQSK